jgi:hypothetical protein
VIASLLGSMAVYCTQATTTSGDMTPVAKAECDAKPKEFVLLGEGTLAKGASEAFEVKGFAEVVVATARYQDREVFGALDLEFALTADGFFGTTGQRLEGGGWQAAANVAPAIGGARIRVDGNYARLTVSRGGQQATRFQIWGVK